MYMCVLVHVAGTYLLRCTMSSSRVSRFERGSILMRSRNVFTRDALAASVKVATNVDHSPAAHA